MKKLLMILPLLLVAVGAFAQLPLRNCEINMVGQGDSLQFKLCSDSITITGNEPVTIVADTVNIIGVFTVNNLPVTPDTSIIATKYDIDTLTASVYSDLNILDTGKVSTTGDVMYGNLQIAGDSLIITDATGADSVRIYDNGTNAYIKTDNGLVINNIDTLIIDSDTITGTIALSEVSGNLAASVTPLDTVFTNFVSNGIFTEAYIAVTLADDATYNLPDAKKISFDVFMDTNYRAIGTVATNGVVNIMSSSYTIIEWDDADTDGKLCIYDGGTAGILRNRSGVTRTFYITLRYND